jgi:hemolysin activation/secretion protein
LNLAGGGFAGKDQWRVADGSLVYSNSDFLSGNGSGTIDLAQGIPGLGASPHDDGLSRTNSHTEFTKISGRWAQIQPIDGPMSFSATMNGQYGFRSLLTGEEISFGGSQVGRGYDPASITGDSGLGGAYELRYDLNAADFDADSLQVYAFYDIGKVWFHVGAAPPFLDAAGVGARAMVLEHVSLGMELGHAFESVPGNDNGKRTTRLLFTGGVRF